MVGRTTATGAAAGGVRCRRFARRAGGLPRARRQAARRGGLTWPDQEPACKRRGLSRIAALETRTGAEVLDREHVSAAVALDVIDQRSGPRRAVLTSLLH